MYRRLEYIRVNNCLDLILVCKCTREWIDDGFIGHYKSLIFGGSSLCGQTNVINCIRGALAGICLMITAKRI